MSTTDGMYEHTREMKRGMARQRQGRTVRSACCWSRTVTVTPTVPRVVTSAVSAALEESCPGERRERRRAAQPWWGNARELISSSCGGSSTVPGPCLTLELTSPREDDVGTVISAVMVTPAAD